ncbi:uncharacterized protein LOC144463558 isoform X2 [Epinephelus lanceolatus]
MDDFVKDRLREWQLESLIQRFEEELIDEAAFKVLDSSVIAKLITRIGLRVRFIESYKNLFRTQDNGIAKEVPAALALSPPRLDSETTVSSTHVSAFNIREVLNKTLEGKGILASMDTENAINVKQRRAMTRICVSHLIERFGEYPSSTTKAQLGASISEQFPCLKDEREQGYEAWFCPGHNHRPAVGFLEECLRNRRKRIPGRQSPYPRTAVAVDARSSRSPILPDRAMEMKEWLKNNIWPQEQVRDYMVDTAIHRAQWIRSDGSKSLPEILAEYPRFLDTPGMIAQDFAILYPEKSEKLTTSWVQMFSTKVLQLAKKERNAQSLLAQLKEDATADERGDMALRVLPLLLPGHVFKVAKKTVRPSVDEARKAFIDTQLAGTNIPEYLRAQARSEPFVAVIGSQAFTVMQGATLLNTTLLGTVDICFKSFFVFDIVYPK